MGDAKNLKLGVNGGKGKGKGTGENNFYVSKMSTLFSCCVHQKRSNRSKSKAPGRGIERRSSRH